MPVDIPGTMTASNTTTSQDDDTTKRKLDLSVTQVTAAALAAVTAALLGSGLGITGTLIGAAGASVILTVGTALYRASLERSQEKIRELARRTRALQVSGGQVSTESGSTGPADAEAKAESRSRTFNKVRWCGAVLGAVGGFVLAMVFISGVEWVSGETLGGHGEGTTFGQVVNSPPEPPDTPDPVVPSVPTDGDSPPAEEEDPSNVQDEVPEGVDAPEGDPNTSPSPTPDESEDDEQDPSETVSPQSPEETEPRQPLIPPLVPGSED